MAGFKGFSRLVLAGLAAEGTTEINRLYHIDVGMNILTVNLRRLALS